jgi:hypothetical protein
MILRLTTENLSKLLKARLIFKMFENLESLINYLLWDLFAILVFLDPLKNIAGR